MNAAKTVLFWVSKQKESMAQKFATECVIRIICLLGLSGKIWNSLLADSEQVLQQTVNILLDYFFFFPLLSFWSFIEGVLFLWQV